MHRDPSVETIRGLAVVLVVLFHSLVSVDGAHLSDAGLSALRWLMAPLVLIRMPLFAAMSGYVAGLGSAGADPSPRRFIAAKARRLLVPFASMLTLTLLVRAARNGLRPDKYPMDWDPGVLLGHFVYGFEHLWYLQALFLMVVGFSALDRLGCVRTVGGWMATTCVAAALALLLPDWRIFNLHEALALSASFLLGVGLARFPAMIFTRTTMVACMLATAVGFATFLLTKSGHLEVPAGRNSLVGVLTAMAAIPVIFRRRLILPVLPTLASYSYSIYLFHTLGLYWGYWLSIKLLQGHDRLLFVLFNAMFAIVFSAAAHHVVTSHPMLAFLFLGERTKVKVRAPRPRPAAIRTILVGQVS
ncbi:acyltransferase [Isosphaeraceae bacterium EP7]